MRLPHEPDNIVRHIPQKCKTCPFLNQCIQSQNVFTCAESRYEVNVVVKTKVTEHQVLAINECKCGCLKGTKGEFPTELKAYVQYGNSFAVLASMLSTYGAVSYNRIATMIRNLTGVSLSEGTLTTMVKRCSLKIDGALDKIKETLQGSKVVHFDETGVRVNGETLWVHNSSSEKFTYLTINQKRGYDGMLDNGVLPEFQGIAVHDCWSSYFKYMNAEHAICCVHLLRELNGIIENEKNQTWATNLRSFF